LGAAETLKAVPVPSKPLAGGTAVMAGHALSPIAFSGEKSHTIYGSRAWVNSALWISPAAGYSQ